MMRYGSLGDLPLGGPRRAVAIGTFDGVHVGHRAVIGRAVAEARGRGLQSMAITFTPNPISVLRPEIRTQVLTGPWLKASLIEEIGVDELLAIPFNRSFARIRAERFVEMLAGPPVGADVVVVGDSFRFGEGGAGTVRLMTDLGRTLGLSVVIPDAVVSADGKPISSTRIRRLLSQGDVAEVAPLLGRHHCVEGVIVEGDARGRTLGIRTANLRPVPEDSQLPARGVYAGRIHLASGCFPAAINVGHAPTFRDSSIRAMMRVEAHVLDYDGGDLYDQPARIEFVARLRDEQRFESPQALVEQIHRDIAEVRSAIQDAAPC